MKNKMAASVNMMILLTRTFQRSSCCLCRRGQHHAAAVTRSGSQPDRSVPRGQVSIPRKKKRDSLSVLKALASTVGEDKTGEHYQLMDDPELNKATRSQRKLFLLSKASGQRAARFIVNEYKNTFNHDDAAPHIEAFQPKPTEYQHTTVCEEALKERITQREVKKAIDVYDKMKQQGLELSKEVQLSFLELLCVYNCMDVPIKLEYQEMLFKGKNDEEEERLTWKDLNKAEEVFDELPEKTEDAYNWIVTGMLKRDNKRGLEFYKEMRSHNMKVHLVTYNELIKTKDMTRHITENWDRILDLLQAMKSEGLSPNLDTFHSIIFGVRATGFAKKVIPKVIAEMKVLGLEPTLQTWTLVLLTLRRRLPRRENDDMSVITDIREILEYMKTSGDEIGTDHFSDQFFLTAMQECGHAMDSDTALLLYNFKQEMGMRYIVTNIFYEYFFNNQLLTLLMKTETCATVMDMFGKLRSSYVTALRSDMYSKLLDVIDMYQEYHHITELWEDFYVETRNFSSFNLEIGKHFFKLMSMGVHSHQLKRDFAQIAKTVYDSLWTSYNDKFSRAKNIMDGTCLGYIMTVLANNKDTDKTWEVLMFYCTNISTLGETMRDEDLITLFLLLVDQRDINRIMNFATIYPTISDGILYQTVQHRYQDLESFLSESQMNHLESL